MPDARPFGIPPVVGATAGHVATLTAPGNVQDGGVPLTTVAGTVDARLFGPLDPTGSVACQATINSAIAYAAALPSGGTVAVPAGTFLCTASLANSAPNVGVCGAGRGQTIFAWGFDGNLIDFDNGATGLTGIRFERFSVLPTATRASGAAIFVRNSAGTLVRDVTIGEDWETTATPTSWDGINLDGQSRCRVENCYVYCLDNAITITGNGEWNYDGVITGCELWGTYTSGVKGIYVTGGIGGLSVSHTNVSLFDQGLYVDASSGTINRELFLGPHLFLDSSGTYGLNVTTNSLTLLHWTDVWTAGCGRGLGSAGFPHGMGVNIAPQVGNFWAVLTGGRSYANQGDGAAISCSNVSITGMQIYGNGLGANGGDGISLLNAGATNFTIVGNQITGNGNSTRGTGVSVISGINNFVIAGNNLAGNAAGALSNPNGTSPTQVVVNNAASPDTPVGGETYLATSLALPTSPSATGLAVTLPFTGTWDITANLRWGAVTAALGTCYLHNDTAESEVVNSQRILWYGAPTNAQGTTSPSWRVTVSGQTTFQIYGGSNDGSGALYNDVNGATLIRYEIAGN